MDKKAGYLLLVLGVGLLLGSAFMLWKICYGLMPGPQVFDINTSITVTLPQGATASFPIPPQVNRFGNLSLAFMLMFFVAGVGGKIARLGVGLMKKPAPDTAGDKQK